MPVLQNKPLVEAIFEFRWPLVERAAGTKVDPHYKILVGRLYDRVRAEYPHHQALPSSAVPDEIAGYVVQHRFRSDEDSWPLVQLGPGVITLNDTDGYVWDDFEPRIHRLLDALFDAYPPVESGLATQRLRLRYLDALEFDFGGNDIFEFLARNMKLRVSFDDSLLAHTQAEISPCGLDVKCSFPCREPKGAIHVRFARGQKRGVDALIWETMVESTGEEAPSSRDAIRQWVAGAHRLSHEWFFQTIDGELRRRFA